MSYWHETWRSDFLYVENRKGLSNKQLHSCVHYSRGTLSKTCQPTSVQHKTFAAFRHMHTISETSSCKLCKYDNVIADTPVYRQRHALILVLLRRSPVQTGRAYTMEGWAKLNSCCVTSNRCRQEMGCIECSGKHVLLTRHISTFSAVPEEATVICYGSCAHAQL